MGRGSGTAEIFFDGASQGSYDISVLTGEIFPTMDLLIGVINGGGSASTAQLSGLDGLAFYSGTLSPGQIAGLADASLTPPDITDSADPESPFRITGVQREADDQVTITWNSKANRVYAIYQSIDLSNWGVEIVDEFTATSDASTVTFTPFQSPPIAYFRVVDTAPK